MKLLLTAFDPFGGETLNPALEAVRQVKPRIGGVYRPFPLPGNVV